MLHATLVGLRRRYSQKNFDLLCHWSFFRRGFFLSLSHATNLKTIPAKWAVQFHPFVTDSIDKVTYRQFNYALLMSHESKLTRWLHKYVVLKCTGADLVKPSVFTMPRSSATAAS
jgi:hypothetical protein